MHEGDQHLPNVPLLDGCVNWRPIVADGFEHTEPFRQTFIKPVAWVCLSRGIAWSAMQFFCKVFMLQPLNVLIDSPNGFIASSFAVKCDIEIQWYVYDAHQADDFRTVVRRHKLNTTAVDNVCLHFNWTPVQQMSLCFDVINVQNSCEIGFGNGWHSMFNNVCLIGLRHSKLGLLFVAPPALIKMGVQRLPISCQFPALFHLQLSSVKHRTEQQKQQEHSLDMVDLLAARVTRV